MANSADPDQLASSEANWSGSTLFAKQGISGFSRTRVKSQSHNLYFHQIHTRVDFYKYSFYPFAIMQWNWLPQNIALLPISDSFKWAVCTVSYTML